MARTHVPEPRALDHHMTKKELLKIVHENIVFAQADDDKCGDMEDCAYYCGLLEAYKHIEALMTVRPPTESKEN